MTALIGISGSLLGVIVGAFLTRWIDFQHERRREVREATASALILREELRDMRAGLTVILKKKEHNDPFLWEGLEAWEEHRERLLAKDISHKAWCELAAIFRSLLELAAIIKTSRGDDWSAEAESALERGVQLATRDLNYWSPSLGRPTENCLLTKPSLLLCDASRYLHINL
jgi:hypothetical protein